MFSFFFVSNSCDKIHFEAQKIINFLYESDECLSDSQQFLSQMLNQPINITAKGFYTLNRSFFAGVSQLIIMLNVCYLTNLLEFISSFVFVSVNCGKSNISNNIGSIPKRRVNVYNKIIT